jgi:hypothetical protein
MARTLIPTYSINRVAYAPPPATPGDRANGMYFGGNGGRSWLEVNNPGTVLCTVGAVVAEGSVDDIVIPDKKMDVPAGSAVHFGPFPTSFYSQPDLTVYFDITAPTDVDGSALSLRAFDLG